MQFVGTPTERVFLIVLSPTIEGVSHRLAVRPDGSFECSLGDDPRIAQAMIIGAATMASSITEREAREQALGSLLEALRLLEGR